VTLRATGMSHRTRLALNEQRFKIPRIWSTFFADFDVSLCPVFGRAAFPRMEGGIRWDRQIQIERALEDDYLSRDPSISKRAAYIRRTMELPALVSTTAQGFRPLILS
jgi:hypothetical protein